MSTNHDRQWEERLEAGAEDDELLALAARLRRAGEATRATPPLAFQRQLRRDLLNQVAVAPQRGANVWRWVGSLAAVAVLAVVVGLMWFSISSSGRPTFGGAAQSEPTALIPTGTATGVDVVSETTIEPPPPPGSIYLEASGLNAPDGSVPGGTLEFTGRWHIPADVALGTGVMAFLHLRDEAGAVVAQADGPLTNEDVTAFVELGDTTDSEPDGASEAWLSRLPLALPADLPLGEYILVTGLYDTNGQRLPVYDLTVGDEIVIGPVTIGQAQFTGAELTVLDMSPAASTILSGTQPITFTVRLAYDAITPPAMLEVKIAETVGENGRGVATTQVTLDSASGEITVPVVLYPAQELNAPAKLGLWLQLQADADAPPQLAVWPEGYRWRYNP